MKDDSRLMWVTPDVYRKLLLEARKRGISISRVLDQFADQLPKRSN
jgi:hypothetical protein